MKKTILLASMFSLVLAACVTPGKNTAIGAAAGTAIGAGVGAATAKLTKGDVKKGAAIGAATGLVAGSAIGNYYDKLAKELAQYADVTKTDNGVKITLKGDILFDTGKSNLTQESMTTLNNLNKVLKRYPKNRIVIHGYTDTTGSAATNELLSKARAKSVYDYLVTQNGLKTLSVEFVGHGPANPVGDNSTAAGRAMNRRVELQITANEKDIQ